MPENCQSAIKEAIKEENLNEKVFIVNQDLYEVNRWTHYKFLLLNAKKFQAIIF